MLAQNLIKLFQCSMLAVAMLAGFTSLSHAGDARDKTPNAQSESSQPQQQAAPVQPASDPESSDEEDEEDDTAFV